MGFGFYKTSAPATCSTPSSPAKGDEVLWNTDGRGTAAQQTGNKLQELLYANWFCHVGIAATLTDGPLIASIASAVTAAIGIELVSGDAFNTPATSSPDMSGNRMSKRIRSGRSWHAMAIPQVPLSASSTR